jgi:hypothetical protein
MGRRLVARRIAAAVALAAGMPGWIGAQPAAKVPRIGVLRWGVPGDEDQGGLTQALAAIGYREGQTITIEWRWATNRELAQRHAAELLAMNPGLQRVAFLGSTQDTATKIFTAQLQAAARVLGVKLQLVLIGQASEFEAAADTMLRERAQAVIVQPLFTLGQSGQPAHPGAHHLRTGLQPVHRQGGGCHDCAADAAAGG